MLNVLKIALSNLARFGRRTLLTSTLITLGIVGVLLFVAICRVVQGDDDRPVHRRRAGPPRGAPQGLCRLDRHSAAEPQHAARDGREGRAGARARWTRSRPTPSASSSAPCSAISPRPPAFASTASTRQKEVATTPLLPGRMIEGSKEGPLLKPGEILIPALLARGMKVKVGDTVVLVATNRDGSVNGKTFTVGGILRERVGPERPGRLHPHRRRARAAADEGARSQRNRDSPQESGAARRGLRAIVAGAGGHRRRGQGIGAAAATAAGHGQGRRIGRTRGAHLGGPVAVLRASRA